MPPKMIAKNVDRRGGMLPVSAAARAPTSKAAAPRLKLEVRRLPPGLTLTEFEETLGDEWKLGGGKVDWREYRQGKTRAPGSGKVPEQSRCYLHVINETCVREFEKRFLEVVFQDRAGTHKSPELKHLAPTLGFAPNQRTPLHQGKQRTDNRQGTIDQDAEFIAFLEAETQPITKAASLEAAQSDKENEKGAIKTTPLIEDLREKKAIKAKAAQAKAEKLEREKKASKAATKDTASTADSNANKTSQQQKVDAAIKEVGKAASKQAAAKAAQQPKAATPVKGKKQPPSPKQPNAVPTQPAAASASPSPASQRVPPSQRPRGSADGIKKMLQKDLGIRPKPAPSSQPTSAATNDSAATSSTPAQKPLNASVQPKVPPAKSATPSNQSADTKSTLFKAYLKHANPSQGMTEMLIQQALAQYGDMVNVVIDPRKGTAIAVFKTGEGLRKALEAKRVPVANGAVEVLEFRERAQGGPSARGGFRGGRGGRGGARGGHNSAAPGPAPASAA